MFKPSWSLPKIGYLDPCPFQLVTRPASDLLLNYLHGPSRVVGLCLLKNKGLNEELWPFTGPYSAQFSIGRRWIYWRSLTGANLDFWHSFVLILFSQVWNKSFFFLTPICLELLFLESFVNAKLMNLDTRLSFLGFQNTNQFHRISQHCFVVENVILFAPLYIFNGIVKFRSILNYTD